MTVSRGILLALFVVALAAGCGGQTTSASPPAVGAALGPKGHGAIRRLAPVDAVERGAPREPASEVEPFVGAMDRWFEPARSPNQPARSYSLSAPRRPVVLHGARMTFVRDRAAAWGRADPLALASTDTGLVEAFDLATGVPFWTASLGVESRAAILGVVSTAQHVVIVRDRPSDSAEVVVVSRRDGHVLWRAPFRERWTRESVLAAGATLLVKEDRSWHAMDLAGGTSLWRVKAPLAGSVAGASDKAVVLGGIEQGAALVLDPRSGTEKARIAVPGRLVGVAISGATAILAVDAKSPSPGYGIVLLGISLADKPRVLWSTSAGSGPPPLSLIEPPQMLVRDDLAYVTALGLMHIHDAKTGELLWEQGVAATCDDCQRSIGSTALVAIAERSLPSGLGSSVAYATPSSVQIFEPAAREPATQDIELHGNVSRNGQPAPGVWVFAYGRSVESGNDGTYFLPLRARGAVTLTPVVEGNHFTSAAVRLDGQRQHAADFDVDRECIEGCGDP
jgi:outer membrane protein assembly factor BamB